MPKAKWGQPDTVMDHATPVGEAWANYYTPGTSPREARAFKAGFAAAERLYDDDWRDEQLVRMGLDYNESVRLGLLLEGVRALHQPKKVWESDRSYTLICRSCELQAWPCRTARELGTELAAE